MQQSGFMDSSRSIVSDCDDEHEEDVKIPNKNTSGLSELSKQLRTLQSTNHSQAAQIDKLERKLQILSELKGVSVNDLKSALQNACQEEAYNEIRMEMETLRAQLEIARSNTTRSTPQTNAMANLELRVGELEEVEESLRTKLSKLYEALRQQTTKTTLFESSSSTYQQQLEDYKTKYESLQTRLQNEHETALKNIQDELESTTTRALEAESHLRREKERVGALTIQVAENTGLRLQITQQKTTIQDLNDTLARQESDSKATLKSKVGAVESKLESTKRRAHDAESKLQPATEKIQDLEQQVAKIFPLELTIARQKVQLKDLAHQTGSQETERGAEMDKLEKRAGKIGAKLQAELTKSKVLQKEVARISDLEQKIAEQEEELATQGKRVEKYRKDRDKAVKVEKVASKATMEGYENRMLELQEKLSKERERTAELEKALSKAGDLDAKCKRQNTELKRLAGQGQTLKKENENATAELSRLESQLTEKEVQLKVQQDKADSLETQVKSTEDEAKLRKKQFKSRFRVQNENMEDLEQQLSSLVTAFNMERGERTEELQTHSALQQSLSGADSKVAHQLHDIEEEKQNPPQSPTRPTVVSVPTFVSPQQQSSTPQKRPFGDQAQVGISQGFLFKKEGFKGWKKRYFFLHGNLTAGVFTLSYGDGPSNTSKGDIGGIGGIRTSISRVQLSNEFPKQPFGFVLRLNPHDSKGASVYFAAPNQDELETWMTALNMVTQGVQTETTSYQSSRQEHYALPVGSKVVIVDLVNHPEYNGLCGTITTPLKEERQCVSIDALKQKVKLSPANLELFALPDAGDEHRQYV